MNIYGLCDVCDLIFHGWTANDLFFYELKDLFFCGRGNPQRAMKVLQTALQAKEVRLSEFKRGFDPGVGILDSASSEQYAPCLVETSAARG